MLFLIGMPAAGKTYWGNKLAKAYGLSFVDLDQYVERKEMMTVAAIFNTYGEEGFRERERDALHEVINDNSVDILACGGGTPFFYENFLDMRDAGCIVYLHASIDTLISRVKKSRIDRPLVGDTDVKKRLIGLFKERVGLYRQADYILEEEKISLANFTQIISSCTNHP